MTDIWYNKKEVKLLVMRPIEENAVELDMMFVDGSNRTIWVQRGEY